MKGKNLARNSKVIKIVRRYARQRGRSRLLGCVRPKGRVYDAGRTHRDGHHGFTLVTVGPSAGTFAVIYSNFGNKTRQTKQYTVFNVGNGARYTFYFNNDGIGARGKAMDPFEPLSIVLTANGQLAGAFGDSVTTVIKVFDSAGATRVLDTGPDSEIPASSVALRGTTLIWTHAGRAMTATL